MHAGKKIVTITHQLLQFYRFVVLCNKVGHPCQIMSSHSHCSHCVHYLENLLQTRATKGLPEDNSIHKVYLYFYVCVSGEKVFLATISNSSRLYWGTEIKSRCFKCRSYKQEIFSSNVGCFFLLIMKILSSLKIKSNRLSNLTSHLY